MDWTFSPGLMAAMIGMIGEYSEGAINLLYQNHARKLMGEGHGTQRDKQSSRFSRFGRPAICWSYRKDEVLDTVVPLPPDPSGKLL